MSQAKTSTKMYIIQKRNRYELGTKIRTIRNLNKQNIVVYVCLQLEMFTGRVGAETLGQRGQREIVHSGSHVQTEHKFSIFHKPFTQLTTGTFIWGTGQSGYMPGSRNCFFSHPLSFKTTKDMKESRRNSGKM